jgi:omega-6 fatty acid desaturase (delta-12 desaturase)
MITGPVKQNRLHLAQYASPNEALAYVILLVDATLYLGCVVLSVLAEHLFLKFLFASIAGFFIAQLFVIGHDAAHTSFVASRRANALIARITFMPALHNYSLWLFAHNRLHHAFPNVKSLNSWSPLTFAEFSALPKWRQLLERLYRSSVGFGPYYLIERWWRDKLFPQKHIPTKYHLSGWRDFGLNVFFLLCLVSGVIALAIHTSQNPLLALAISVVVPFIVWNYAMGLTIYQHHTHPQVQWYKNFVEWRENVSSQGEVTIYVSYPRWYLFVTHNIYVHPVHHVNAKIPLYRLYKAQTEYMKQFPGQTHVIPFSVKALLQTVNACKLYDYTHHQWLDFAGQPTTPALATAIPASEDTASTAIKSAG